MSVLMYSQEDTSISRSGLLLIELRDFGTKNYKETNILKRG